MVETLSDHFVSPGSGESGVGIFRGSPCDWNVQSGLRTTYIKVR